MKDNFTEIYLKISYDINDGIRLGDQLENLNNFLVEFKDHPELFQHKDSLRYLKGEALFKLGRFDESLHIFQELKDDMDPGVEGLIIKKIAEIFKLKGNLNELDKLIDDFLKTTHGNNKLDILVWYSNNFDQTEDYLKRFNNIINELSVGSGISFPNDIKTDKQRILYLHYEDKNASSRYSEVMLALRKIPHEEKVRQLREYVKIETHSIYRTLAEQAITRIMEKQLDY